MRICALAFPFVLALAGTATAQPSPLAFVPDRAAIPAQGITVPVLMAFDRAGRLVREWDGPALRRAGGGLGLDHLTDAPPVPDGRFPTLATLAPHLQTESGAHPMFEPADLTLVWVSTPAFRETSAVDVMLDTFAAAHAGRVAVVRARYDLQRYLQENPSVRYERRETAPTPSPNR